MPFQCWRLSRMAAAIGTAIVRINASAAGAMNNAGAIRRCRRDDRCGVRTAVAICAFLRASPRRRTGRRRSRQETRRALPGHLPRAAITSASIFLAPSCRRDRAVEGALADVGDRIPAAGPEEDVIGSVGRDPGDHRANLRIVDLIDGALERRERLQTLGAPVVDVRDGRCRR